MANWHLHWMHIEFFAKHYRGDKFHALLCDPPYHLHSMVKRFGKRGSAAAKPGVFRRASRGFMGMNWDGGDIAFRSDFWSTITQHLLPGAFVMAFAGSRTYHRMAIAMEDAGLEIFEPLGWVNAGGMPKATRIDRQLAKRGVEDSEGWSGYRYGHQSIKPAFEFIAIAQKPHVGKQLDSIVANGTGVFNIQGCRLDGAWQWGTQTDIRGNGYGNKRPSDGHVLNKNVQGIGRWPSTLYLTHHPGCVYQGKKIIQNPSGDVPENTSSEPHRNVYGDRPRTAFERYGGADGREEVDAWQCHPNCPVHCLEEQVGRPVAHYFHNSSWSDEITERLTQTDKVHYASKVSASERRAGLKTRNDHPTLKPIGLTEYLARLLLPPGLYAPRQILIPFARTGSEMIGAWRAGWDEVVGVEMTKKYVETAKQRLKHYISKNVQLRLVV